MQDFTYLCEKLDRDREKIPYIDIAIENLKQLLIVGLGIKINKKPDETLEQFKDSPLGTFTFTTAEKEAWLKAGMPEPTSFLKAYRNGN